MRFIIYCLLALCSLACAAEPFSAYILDSVRTMPKGGGYAADRVAEVRLAERGIVRQGRQLRIDPQGAAPTFCSAACYMALLRALQRWEREHAAFSPAVWESLRVEPKHPDGYLSWGRANANGPGFAKWAHDLGVGENFTDPAKAQPGDFLKFFHTPHIGSAERGHMVVYLGRYTSKEGTDQGIIYWSSNKPGGYGVSSISLSKIHHLIFTRITHPERFAKAPSLPAEDSWLGSMLSSPCTYAEVCRRCRAR